MLASHSLFHAVEQIPWLMPQQHLLLSQGEDALLCGGTSGNHQGKRERSQVPPLPPTPSRIMFSPWLVEVETELVRRDVGSVIEWVCGPTS